MIHVGCNLCRHLIAESDADAVREGVGAKGARVDICGACMRDAAGRVAARLRPADRPDPTPVPRSVQQAALQVRLPHHLARR